jgi:hypothetical protein
MQKWMPKDQVDVRALPLAGEFCRFHVMGTKKCQCISRTLAIEHTDELILEWQDEELHIGTLRVVLGRYEGLEWHCLHSASGELPTEQGPEVRADPEAGRLAPTQFAQ